MSKQLKTGYPFVMTIRVTPELHARLKAAAKASDKSLNEFCVISLQATLAFDEAENQPRDGDWDMRFG